MTDTTLSVELKEIIRELKNLRFEYKIIFYPEEGTIETVSFANPQNGLDFYTSINDEQNPSLKVLLTASMGNFSHSCLAPITLASLTFIVDNENQIPEQVEEKALQALATRILKNLPFNSDAHGCVI